MSGVTGEARWDGQERDGEAAVEVNGEKMLSGLKPGWAGDEEAYSFYGEIKCMKFCKRWGGYVRRAKLGKATESHQGFYG